MLLTAFINGRNYFISFDAGLLCNKRALTLYFINLLISS